MLSSDQYSEFLLFRKVQGKVYRGGERNQRCKKNSFTALILRNNNNMKFLLFIKVWGKVYPLDPYEHITVSMSSNQDKS